MRERGNADERGGMPTRRAWHLNPVERKEEASALAAGDQALLDQELPGDDLRIETVLGHLVVEPAHRVVGQERGELVERLANLRVRPSVSRRTTGAI